MIELLVEAFQAAVHGFPDKAQGAAVSFPIGQQGLQSQLKIAG